MPASSLKYPGYPTSTHISPNFQWWELGVTSMVQEPYRSRLIQLCWHVLEEIRAHFGVGFSPTSGYRDKKKQAILWAEALKKYGSEAEAHKHVSPPGCSQHEEARAADIVVPGISPTAVAQFAQTLPIVGGIGIYLKEGFTHVDIRPRTGGAIARW